eukprot:CAMPEP_0198330362 /NCGR_PEP_ID=MMETSP1450-20131203/16865_1 /TAXON_ID=753684 ORGANISM="Madagascaria erythrocladiodes, Strain CCMP3234" /NCGR_SAMPLE_ID=MMETSP1450 /ASSEMBLY_ACC=CAM_ASM_001115 /LENGTH=64 /DNA_ID=CAMNT_0044034651 /DNA_START=198 /DNA_END=389 /DNA_ORIENTATION=+
MTMSNACHVALEVEVRCGCVQCPHQLDDVDVVAARVVQRAEQRGGVGAADVRRELDRTGIDRLA